MDYMVDLMLGAELGMWVHFSPEDDANSIQLDLINHDFAAFRC